MKKNLFIVLTMMLAFSASAQKMKIKKGEIQFDRVSDAKIEKQKKSNAFLLSDLKGNPLFTVSQETKIPSGIALPSPMLVFTGTNGNVQEISTADIESSFTFNTTDYLVQLVINCRADLITSQGVNQDKINDFFKTSSRSVSDAFMAVIEQRKAELAKEDELANSVNLTVSRKGDILANGKKIGNISVKQDEMRRPIYTYLISELNDIPIASMIAKETTQPNLHATNTYDGKVISVFTESGYAFLLDNDENAKRMVRKLYYEGYTLGDMKDYLEEKQRAEEEALIAVSGNIYEKQGYVIDKNGKKVEGWVTLEFMPKSDALGKTDSSIEELRKYGKQVLVQTKKEEDLIQNKDFLLNRDSTKTILNQYKFTYHASDGVRVVVDDIEYLGVAGSLLGKETFFYKIVYEKDENIVLHEHKRNNVILKLANQKKPTNLDYGTLLGDKKPEKLKKEFDDYVNCSALTYSDYKTNTIDGLIQLVNDYTEKCK